MPKSLVCPQCGQGFTVKPSRLNKRKFCSNACYDASGERAENGRNNGMKGKTPYKVHPLLGKKHSSESIQKMREVKLGKKNPRYGVTLTESQREALLSANFHLGMLGKHHSEETRQLMSVKEKELWSDPMYFKKRMKECGAKPNKSELLLDSWIQGLSPGEWKFVGAGDFILGGKNPDWLNINGHKALIELFGEPWHPESDEPETIEHYAKFGFKTLVIWYKELKNKEAVLEKIRNFQSTVG